MSTATTAPAELAERFVAALNSHDIDAVMALCTEDTVFESTGPAPDGSRHVGDAEVRRVLAGVLADPATRFSVEGRVVADDDVVVVRWRYDFTAGHARGVTLYTFRDGLIALNQAYVKG